MSSSVYNTCMKSVDWCFSFLKNPVYHKCLKIITGIMSQRFKNFKKVFLLLLQLITACHISQLMHCSVFKSLAGSPEIKIIWNDTNPFLSDSKTDLLIGWQSNVHQGCHLKQLLLNIKKSCFNLWTTHSVQKIRALKRLQKKPHWPNNEEM